MNDQTYTEYARGYAAGQKAVRWQVRLWLMKHVEEVKNHLGGVIGYRLNLDADETAELFSIVQQLGTKP